jgi:hypothetical protein
VDANVSEYHDAFTFRIEEKGEELVGLYTQVERYGERDRK